MTSPESEDDALIEGLRRKDQTAWARVVREYQGRIRGWIRQRLKCDDNKANDIAQAVITTFYRKIHLYRGEGLASFLYVMTRNQCIDNQRQEMQKTRLERRYAERGGGPGSTPTEEVDRQRVWDAVESLPKAYSEALTLYYLKGRSYDDIAGTLGVSINTVKSRLHRGKLILRERLHSSEGR